MFKFKFYQFDFVILNDDYNYWINKLDEYVGVVNDVILRLRIFTNKLLKLIIETEI